MFHVGTPNTAANFTKTRDVLINHIYETYENSEDIGKALENLEKCDLTKVKPTLKKSKKTSKEAQEVENEQFKLEFKTDYDEYKKRERVLAANMTKAYAFLWSHCTKEMQDQVQARKEFPKTINCIVESHPATCARLPGEPLRDENCPRFDEGTIHVQSQRRRKLAELD